MNFKENVIPDNNYRDLEKKIPRNIIKHIEVDDNLVVDVFQVVRYILNLISDNKIVKDKKKKEVVYFLLDYLENVLIQI